MRGIIIIPELDVPGHSRQFVELYPEIFGVNNSILSIANSISTIPYEILSCLNRRIKRVYINV